MSMAHSLELRVPFLDRQVLAAAQALPRRYRCTGRHSVQQTLSLRGKARINLRLRRALRQALFLNLRHRKPTESRQALDVLCTSLTPVGFLAFSHTKHRYVQHKIRLILSSA